MNWNFYDTTNSFYQNYKLQRYKLLKLNKGDIYRQIADKFFTCTLSIYTAII